MQVRFKVVLTPDPDEGGFTVSVPALPGCLSQGDTQEEALENIREAIELHLEVLEEELIGQAGSFVQEVVV